MATSETRLPYAAAYAVAQRLLDEISDCCDAAIIAGSIRRGEPTCGDIEIVASLSWCDILSTRRNIAVRHCSACSRDLPVSDFSTSSTRKDGLYSICKECYNRRKREQYASNPQRKLAQNRAWAKANAERLSEYQARWHQENRERRALAFAARRPLVRDRQREADRRYRENNAERARARDRRYRQNHPEKNREGCARRKARIRLVSVEPVDYRAILERDGWVCHICGGAVLSANDLQFDHIVPLSRGGAHSMENIAVAHGTCNNRKGPR